MLLDADDRFCTRGLLEDVGVDGRELEPEEYGTFLVEGETDLSVVEEAPILRRVGGVADLGGLVWADARTFLVVDLDEDGADVLVSECNFFDVDKTTFSVSLSQVAASWDNDPSFRLVGGVKFDNFTPPIFFSSPLVASCFLRISRTSGDVYLSLFLS